MSRAVVTKGALVLLACCCIALGAAMWLLPQKGNGGVGFTAGDLVAGVGLILCGLIFAGFALLVRPGGGSNTPAAKDHDTSQA